MINGGNSYPEEGIKNYLKNFPTFVLWISSHAGMEASAQIPEKAKCRK
jgi:hypothetical protein